MLQAVLAYYRHDAGARLGIPQGTASVRGRRNNRRAGKSGIHMRGTRPSTSVVPPIVPLLTRTGYRDSQSTPAPWSLHDGLSHSAILDSVTLDLDMYMHTCVCRCLYLYMHTCVCMYLYLYCMYIRATCTRVVHATCMCVLLFSYHKLLSHRAVR